MIIARILIKVIAQLHTSHRDDDDKSATETNTDELIVEAEVEYNSDDYDIDINYFALFMCTNITTIIFLLNQCNLNYF